MGAFNGLLITTKGLALQAKAQAGTLLHFNRIAMGDGSLSGQDITAMNALISEKKSLAISKLVPLTNGKAVVGSSFSNSDVTTAFYFREIGVFAQDPDIGEILYCYGNAGVNADQIPAAGSGTDKVEKAIDVITIVGNAASVTADINNSLIFVTQAEFDDTVEELTADGSVTDARIGNRTITDSVAAATGADTITQLFSKIGNMIKAITGKPNWFTAPATTLEAAKTHIDATTGIHGMTSAANANKGMQRDANGRSQVADPAAAADIATKGYVDGRIVTGTYTGDGTTNRTISIGFTPRFVTVSGYGSAGGFIVGQWASNAIYGMHQKQASSGALGWGATSSNTDAPKPVTGGFTVTGGGTEGNQMNASGGTYTYMAFL